MEGKQGSEGGTSSIFALTDGVTKTSLVDRRVSAPKCDASTLPSIEMLGFLHAGRRSEINRRFPSEMWRRLCVCSTVRSAPASRERSWCSDTTNSCARYGLSAGKIRRFGHPSLFATLAVLLCFSFAGQAETILHRSRDRLAPVIAISSSRAAQRTYHRHSRHSYTHSQPTSILGLSRHNAGGEGLSMPLRNPPSRNQRPPPTEGPRAMGDVGEAELSPTGSVSR